MTQLDIDIEKHISAGFDKINELERVAKRIMNHGVESALAQDHNAGSEYAIAVGALFDRIAHEKRDLASLREIQKSLSDMGLSGEERR